MSWPKGRGKYLHFTLHKENIDITEAVNTLAKLLRTKPNNITYAGTKDKRAKTTQRMCVNLRPAELLAKHNMRSLTVGNFSYHDKPLHLGHLSGNRFKVAIRDVNGDDEDVTKAMDSLSKFGFINYFGLQRFGSSASVPTHMIGKAILSADWKLAVELILKPREGERGFKDLKAAREEWWKSKNPAKAVKCLSKHDRSIEGKVLQTLKSQGSNAYCNAIFTIPRNTLMLYVHAYQSLIWNKIVSRRIKEFGLKPIAGDLVIDDSGTNGEDDKVDSSEDEETNGDEEEIDAVVQEKSDSKASDYKRPIVKLLTKEDLETTPIDRIVYPMPGHDVVYPDNAIASWYTEALSEDNLTPENFKSTHKVFSVFGTYRNLLGRVENLEWRTVGYQNFNDDLILSDLDKLKNKELPEMPEGQFKAIIMEFSLKPSTYATMVLREVMKCETSGSHHAALTIANHSENSENKKCKLSDS
ncbi:hypothetical protein AAG570_011581 [Ranatra chinensis]|uniref:TRUD domain-containing protein n=1 Tax=Ranatra chinensis TaxID=642074 RepID=A0ABD0YL39_9HEMI